MKKSLLPLMIATMFASCMTDGSDSLSWGDDVPIRISVEQTRANDISFENGDQVGLYVVNYENEVAGMLCSSGNYVDNMCFTFDGSWRPEDYIYWKDETTKTDFYAYYPYSTPMDITAHTFSVLEDQSSESNYFASDFLWGKRENVTPTREPVSIATKHLLSNALIYVVAGEGLTASELAVANIAVKVCNIKTNAEINLATGEIVAMGDDAEITPWNTGEFYRAMIVPQSVTSDKNLVEILIDGEKYMYATDMTFESGVRHKITITISKSDAPSNSEELIVNFTIEEWNDDEKDYGGDAVKSERVQEFLFEVSNIGEQSADLTITAKEATRTFYWSIHTKAEILTYESTAAFMEAWHKNVQSYVDLGAYTWAELLDTGSATHTSTSLKSGTTYYLWAYGVDANGNCTSTDLSYYQFTTKPSTFDTNSWVGNWTLTPSKLFWEMIITDPQGWNQGIVANERNTTYTLEIVDGASEDPSLKGYALVYGWDANIPQAPALGLYVDNTIEILGEEVVSADGEYLLTWLPVVVNVEDDKDFIYATGIAGWFTPYILTMNADGSVDFKGGTGLTTGGGNRYQAEVFKLEWVLGDGIYSAIQVDDEEIIHPAGNTMTAVKVAAGDNGAAVAPAKLSAKKNFKVMHKYANAKSAAMQFSTAVKASMIRK